MTIPGSYSRTESICLLLLLVLNLPWLIARVVGLDVGPAPDTEWLWLIAIYAAVKHGQRHPQGGR